MSPHAPKPRCSFSHQRGTTLIEALVAVVVLSVGLLGMAGLQANTLKLNQASMQRSQATILAYTILDQMRSDTAAAKAGSYDLKLDATPEAGSALETWRDEITRTLGTSAKGAICRVAAPATECGTNNEGEFFQITIEWTASETKDASGKHTLIEGSQKTTVVGRL